MNGIQALTNEELTMMALASILRLLIAQHRVGGNIGEVCDELSRRVGISQDVKVVREG
jgi:hypothetical protein